MYGEKNTFELTPLRIETDGLGSGASLSDIRVETVSGPTAGAGPVAGGGTRPVVLASRVGES